MLIELTFDGGECSDFIMMKIGNDNERLRHIRLHERVNELPDPNYATLKYFMGHLYE